MIVYIQGGRLYLMSMSIRPDPLPPGSIKLIPLETSPCRGALKQAPMP